MESLFCEVIGCGKLAAWRLLPFKEPLPEEPILEEYICDGHCKELARMHPDLASHYIPLQRK